MSSIFGPQIVADATAERTFRNIELAAEASGPDGVVYLQLRNGQGLRGLLVGVTTTHLILNCGAVAIADIETYDNEGDHQHG